MSLEMNSIPKTANRIEPPCIHLFEGLATHAHDYRN